MKHPRINFLAAAALAIPMLAHGLATDKDKPIELNADSAELDQTTGTSVYTGNVVITQGSLKVNADKVTVYTADGGVQRIVGVGSPARFRQRPEGKDEDVKGEGRTLEYLAASRELVITTNAMVEQGGDVLKGDQIRYQLNTDRVQASRGAGQEERVRILLSPQRAGDR